MPDQGIQYGQPEKTLALEGPGPTGSRRQDDGALKFYQDELLQSGMSLDKMRSLQLQTDHCHSVTPEQIQIAARLGQIFSCDATEAPS